LPLVAAVVLTLQAYLVISALSLIYLTMRPVTADHLVEPSSIDH